MYVIGWCFLSFSITKQKDIKENEVDCRIV